MKLESLTTSLRSVARELRRGLKEREEEAAIVVEEAKARVLLRAVLLVRGARVGGTVNSFRHCQLQLSIYIYISALIITRTPFAMRSFFSSFSDCFSAHVWNWNYYFLFILQFIILTV